MRLKIQDESGQSPHIVENHLRAPVAQGIAVTGAAMAAAMEAEHDHAGGPGGGHARQTVLDHDAS